MTIRRWHRAISIQVILVILAVGLIQSQGLTTERSRGVTRSRIKIGIHAPSTGAAPLPNESLQRAADIYWRWRKAKDRPINGRHVEVVLKNDNYNPSQAVAVCKEMVQKDKVFLLSGLLNPSGHDQTQACARYAESVGVPYVGLGQMRLGVDELDRYFAATATYKRQGHLLADYIVSRLKARHEVNGVIWRDSPNLRDPHDSFTRTMERKGSEVEYDRNTNCCPGQQDAQVIVQEMKAMGVKNAFVLITPVFFLQLLKAADNQDYHPQWVGISSLPPHETIVQSGCTDREAQGTRLLTPLPAFADRAEFSRGFDRAMKRFYGNDQGDDVVWNGWATSKFLAKLFSRSERALDRKRFVRRTERSHAVRTGILPRAEFTPRNHFGGKGIHVVKADCQRRRWVTIASFKQDF